MSDAASGTWDYIIVGGGSAGAIVTERLSADGRNRVLLLEAGGSNRHPFVVMPKGISKLIASPERTWTYQIEGAGRLPPEIWFKGRMLGGSSAINAMMYFRGQTRDYDDWAEAGAAGWDWASMRQTFAAMENHALGGDEGRGADGPLAISIASADPISEAFIAAGEQMGLPRVADLNVPAPEAVGYTPLTLRAGRRMSSARAFLDPARRRPNLRVQTHAVVEDILFEGTRAVGVRCRIQGKPESFRCTGEVILSAGAVNSPAILQRSGVGPADHLAKLGIPVVTDNRAVGDGLLEHRTYKMYYDVAPGMSENGEYRGARLLGNALRYAVARSGPLSRPPFTASAFFRTMPGLDRADAQVILGPFVMASLEGKLSTEPQPSIHLFPYPCRPRSRGSVRVTAADATAAPRIHPNYLADDYDRQVSIRSFRFMRDWMRKPAIAPHVVRERDPIAQVQTDDEILSLFVEQGESTFHSCGTCRMGTDDAAAVDEALRVRGVSGLRVIDASVMPTMPSCNTNGPTLGIGWRGAELILKGRNR